MSSTLRYLTASTPSAYLVAMPKKAAIHIQNKAPGPPAFTAVATPTILPVPTVAAKAVHSAWKLLTSPLPLLRAEKISCKALGSFITWSKPKRVVSMIPVPIKRTIRGGPHTKASKAFKKSNMFTNSPLNLMANLYVLPLITK